jgi:hypothetical protein
MAFNDTMDRNATQLKHLTAQSKAYNTDDAYTKSNHAADINDLAEDSSDF